MAKVRDHLLSLIGLAILVVVVVLLLRVTNG